MSASAPTWPWARAPRVPLPPPRVPAARCAKDEAKTVAPSFDPEALERGAKALREINSSPHAKNVSVLPPSRPALTPISLPIPRSAKNNPDGWIDLDPIVTY